MFGKHLTLCLTNLNKALGQIGFLELVQSSKHCSFDSLNKYDKQTTQANKQLTIKFDTDLCVSLQ